MFLGKFFKHCVFLHISLSRPYASQLGPVYSHVRVMLHRNTIYIRMPPCVHMAGGGRNGWDDPPYATDLHLVWNYIRITSLACRSSLSPPPPGTSICNITCHAPLYTYICVCDSPSGYAKRTRSVVQAKCSSIPSLDSKCKAAGLGIAAPDRLCGGRNQPLCNVATCCQATTCAVVCRLTQFRDARGHVQSGLVRHHKC